MLRWRQSQRTSVSTTSGFANFPPSLELCCAGNRTASQAIVSSFARDYMLPPFYTTTEIRAERRNFGHYMTNWGASLSSIMFGMTGLQLGSMDTTPSTWGDGRVGALPSGWERISYEGWLGQEQIVCQGIV